MAEITEIGIKVTLEDKDVSKKLSSISQSLNSLEKAELSRASAAQSGASKVASAVEKESKVRKQSSVLISETGKVALRFHNDEIRLMQDRLKASISLNKQRERELQATRNAAVATTQHGAATALAGKYTHDLSGNLSKSTLAMAQFAGVTNRTNASLGVLLNNISYMVAGTFAARALVNATDNYSKFQSQIDLATKSTAEFAQVQEGVTRIAFDNRVAILPLTKLYSALGGAMKQMGGSTTDALDVVDLFSKALQLSSPSATEAASATLQFTQAMGSGVLRGEEFNSIMENGRGIAMKLADGLGVPIGQLRAMAEAGKLTSEVVINALKSQASAIERDFKKVPLTISASLENLRTGGMLFVGTLDDMIGASSGAATALSAVGLVLQTLAENLDEVAIVATVGLAVGLTAKTIPSIWATSTALNAAMISAGGFTAAMRAATASALAFAATPLGLAITAVAGTIAYLALRTDETEVATQDLTEAFREQNIVLSKSEIKLRAAELAIYRQKLQSLLELKSQNSAVDVFDVKQGVYEESIARLTAGKEALVTVNELIAEQNEGLGDTTKWLKTAGQVKEEFFNLSIDNILAENQRIQEYADAWVRVQEAISDVGRSDRDLAKVKAERFAQSKGWSDLEVDGYVRAKLALFDTEKAFSDAEQAKKDARKAREDSLATELANEEALIKAVEKAEKVAQKAREDALATELANEEASTKIIEKSLSDTQKLIDSVNDYGDSWTRTGDKALDAMGSMMSVMAKVSKSDKAIADQKADLEKKGLQDTKEYIELEKARAKNSIKGSTEMMGAASAMFKQGTAEQKLAHDAYLVMNAIELAADMQKLTAQTSFTAMFTGLKATEASASAVAGVANQAAGDPYTAIPRMVAMTAMMAGLLSQLGLSFGGASGSVSDVANRQVSGVGVTGGGTTDSINNSWEMLQDINADQYTELKGIYSEMQDLNNNITGIISASYAGGDFTSLTSVASSSMASDVLDSLIYNPLSSLASEIDKITGVGVMGGVVGAVGNLIGGAVNSVFGKTSKYRSDYGYSIGGTLGDAAIGGYETIRTKKDGGWFGKSSSKDRDKATSISYLSEQAFGLVFDNIAEMTIKLGDKLDRDVKDTVNSFELSIGKISATGSSDDFTKRVNEALSAQTDKLANEVFGDIIDGYRKVNESAFDTLSRVVIEKVATADILDMTGLGDELTKTLGYKVAYDTHKGISAGVENIFSSISFAPGLFGGKSTSYRYFNELGDAEQLASITEGSVTAIKADAIAISQSLVGIAGGLKELKSAADNYYDAFFTDSEKEQRNKEQLIDLVSRLNADYENLNLTVPVTRDEVRNMVEGLDLTTEAGQKAYVSLVKASDGLDMYISEIERIAEEHSSLTDRILELTNATEYEALLKVRQLESLDESNRSLQEQIWSLEDQKAAAEEAAKALQAYNDITTGLTDRLLQLTNAEDYLKLTRDRALSGLDDYQKSLQEQIWSLEDQKAAAEEYAKVVNDLVSKSMSSLQKAIAARNNQLQDEVSVIQDSISALGNLKSSLKSTFEQILPTISSSPTQFAQSQAVLFSALEKARITGELPTQEEIEGHLATVANNDQSYYSSFEDYAYEQSLNARVIKDLESLTDTQLSVDERSLLSLEQQIEQNNDMLAKYQEQIDILNGVDVSVLSVAEAVAKVEAAIYQLSSISTTQANSALVSSSFASTSKTTSEIQAEGLYSTYLGRDADVKGLANWAAAIEREGGVTQNVLNNFLNTPEINGSHANGLEYVPFDGYRAELHKGEAVVTARESNIFRGGAIVLELQSLRGEISALRQQDREIGLSLIRNTADTNDYLEEMAVTV